MKRYTCTCDPALYNDIYVHSRQVIVDLPVWTIAVKERLRMNYTPDVCIDGCIVNAIKELWSKGIETTGCCCGHNIMPGWVSVHEAWYVDMFKLGYEQRPVEVVNGRPMGLYTFYL
jgi:hypothetical protein